METLGVNPDHGLSQYQVEINRLKNAGPASLWSLLRESIKSLITDLQV